MAIHSAQSKANRLRSARIMAGLSRKEMENFGIPENTLRMWEHPRDQSSGLTEKGASRIVNALKEKNILCTVDWLLRGVGDGPKTYQEINDQIIEPLQNFLEVPAVDWGEEEIILKEIETFCRVNPDPAILRVNDNSMAPYINSGDYVGGNKKYGNEIINFIGVICVIELSDHVQICRRLDKGKKGLDTYTLSCINPMASIESPVLYDVPVCSVAQVIWIRKTELESTNQSYEYQNAKNNYSQKKSINLV